MRLWHHLRTLACIGLLNLITPSIAQGATMSTVETESFTWGFSISHYNLDLGISRITTLINDCWFADAQGKKRQFYGSTGQYGVGAPNIGGTPALGSLPKTLHLQYYDYQFGRFYKLDVELPQAKLYQLFKQKTIHIDADDKPVVPRYNEITIGIAPNGFVMLWVSVDRGYEQIELMEPLRAQEIEGMTVESYNNSARKSFRLYDRWEYISGLDTYKASLKRETVNKLKSGWLPDGEYYSQQRIKYPWRYRMTGNARMLEFKESQANQEQFYIGPWQLPLYEGFAQMRGVPVAATFWFVDKAGKRHSLYLGFFKGERVTGEEDVSEVWAAFEALLGKRELWQNEYLPGNEDMATVDVHLSDDLQTLNVRLVKGDKSVDFPVHRTQFFDLAPYTHWPKGETPDKAAISRLMQGPDAR